jgi:aldehyde:ferredoxin oxidoreductase
LNCYDSSGKRHEKEYPEGAHIEPKTMAPYVKGMVRDYYRLCGWDESHGKPWRRTLERTGLSEYIKDAWG